MSFVRKKELKILKLCLISPLLEQTMNVIYLLSLPIIIYKFLHIPSTLNNYELNKNAKFTFRESSFRNIQTSEEYIKYIEELLNILYIPKAMPLFIPIGCIRIKRFSIQNECQIRCDKNLDNSDKICEINTRNLTRSTFKDCRLRYNEDTKRKNSTFYNKYNNKSFYDNFVSDYVGKYSSYSLFGEGEYYDFTHNDKNFKNNIISFIGDKDIKFLLLSFNVYSPHTNSYINVINGLEMIDYFKLINHSFTCTINFSFENGDLFLFLIYIVFSISVFTTLLKLVYEINIKLNIVIHLISFVYEFINVVLIVLIILHISLCKEYILTDDLFYSKNYINFLPIIYTREYVILVLSILIFCYPYRIIGFLSWFRITDNMIIFMNIIFRMLPGLLLTSILAFVYNEDLFSFSNVINSLTNAFKLYEIGQNMRKYYLESMFVIPIYEFYNFMLLICLVFIIFVFISSCVYMFKKSANLEIIKENNQTHDKLIELHEKFNKYANKNEKIKENEEEDNTQFIWLNLTEFNTLFEDICSESTNVILFKTSNHIISFLKYLFAIKPNMQFQKLYKRFAIIIEADPSLINYDLSEEDLGEIDCLFDWLNFAGCKIPIYLYTHKLLDRYLRMNLNSNYWNISFIDNKHELFKIFFKEQGYNKTEVKPSIKPIQQIRKREIAKTYRIKRKSSKRLSKYNTEMIKSIKDNNVYYDISIDEDVI